MIIESARRSLATLKSLARNMGRRSLESIVVREGLGQVGTDMFLEPASLEYDPGASRAFEEVPNGKVVIFGIPKAGNVWLQSLLVDYFDVSPVLRLEEVDRKGVLSIHDPFNPAFCERSDFVYGACLIRDLRDIVVSYFHYAQTQDWRRAMTRHHYEDIETFYYDWFLSRAVPAHRLHSFADEYAERGIPIVRYERLRQDTSAELVRLLRRWGHDPDPASVDVAISRNAFDRLRSEGKNLRYSIPPTHFRRGEVGSWRTELPPAIAADMNWRFEEFLRRWGYALGDE